MNGLLLLLHFFAFVSIASSTINLPTYIDVDIENPVVNVTLVPVSAPSPMGSEGESYAHICICGRSFFVFWNYANVYRLTFVPSIVIPKGKHSDFQICIHETNYTGICQGRIKNWISVKNGPWSYVTDTYDNKYIDVKFVNDSSGFVTVTLVKEIQGWRFGFLASGIILLSSAPMLSKRLSLVFITIMAIAVLLVNFIHPFKGITLVPFSLENLLHFIWELVYVVLLDGIILIGLMLVIAFIGYMFVNERVKSSNGDGDDGNGDGGLGKVCADGDSDGDGVGRGDADEAGLVVCSNLGIFIMALTFILQSSASFAMSFWAAIFSFSLFWIIHLQIIKYRGEMVWPANDQEMVKIVDTQLEV